MGLMIVVPMEIYSYLYQRVSIYTIPYVYNEDFLFDLVEFYFERIKEGVFVVDGVKHIYYPVPVGAPHKVYIMFPLFIFGNAFVINIIYILASKAAIELKGVTMDNERDSSVFRCQEAIISLFQLIDLEPPYRNAAELNALITLLCAVCPLPVQARICSQAHYMFKER